MSEKSTPTGIENTGPDPISVGNPYTDQEDAANSTKDADSVQAVANPSERGDQPQGLPKWPDDAPGKGDHVESDAPAQS